MYNLPAKLNGYTLISVMPIVRNSHPPRFLHDGEGIMLGEDLTRRHGKYVVAHVALNAPTPPTEWYWGFYTDNLVDALDRFMRKTNVTATFEAANKAIDEHEMNL